MACEGFPKSSEDIQMLMKAFDFAAIKHKDQRRKDGCKTPYINHPIGVAQIISKEANITDVNILIGAVLHDTVEDTDATYDEIECEFGPKVRQIVYDCSDDKTLAKEDRKRIQIEKSPFVSYEAKVVKLADKLYNLRDIEKQTPVGWSKERCQAYFQWAYKVVKGMKGACKPLEDILDEMFKKWDVKMD